MKIFPAKLRGTIAIQPSKSYLHRMIIMSSLSGRTVKINNVNYSEDIKATLYALETMGMIKYECNTGFLLIHPENGQVTGKIDCGESGSTLRFLIALGLTTGKELTFTGHGRLMERPQNVYSDLCSSMGFTFDKKGNTLKIQGMLQPGSYTLPGNISSQFISGMLMALSAINGQSTLHISGSVESQGYIDITCDVLSAFGVDIHKGNNSISINGGISAPNEVTAPGDWSHAANFACMSAKSGDITICGVNLNSFQKDKTVIDILSSMGVGISSNGDNITFLPSKPFGKDIDGKDIPDIIPALSVVLGICCGKWRIKNIGRLRIKESDRIEAVCSLINNIGGKASSSEDSIIIEGTKSYKGGKVSSFNDHRIAMAAAVASCFSTGIIEIDNSKCVAKSAPAFWQEFVSLGGKITEENHV